MKRTYQEHLRESRRCAKVQARSEVGQMSEQRVEGLTVDEPVGIRAVEAGELSGRRLRYYDYCMAAFAVILICANLIGAGKVAVVTLPLIGPLAFGAGILFFPLSYVLGDVLTEVYGYARARRVVWVGFAASVIFACLVVSVPRPFLSI